MGTTGTKHRKLECSSQPHQNDCEIMQTSGVSKSRMGLTTFQNISVSGEKLTTFPETYRSKWNLQSNSSGAKIFEKVIASYVWRQSKMSSLWVLCKSELLHIQSFIWWYKFNEVLQSKISPIGSNVDFRFVETWEEYRGKSVTGGKLWHWENCYD